MEIYDEKVHGFKGKDLTLKMEMTTNIFGGFDMGDGEYFTNYEKLFNGEEPDFYIQTLVEGDVYTVYFIPSERIYDEVKNHKKIDPMYTNVFEVKTTLGQVGDYIINNNKVGIYHISFETSPLIVEDMMWYYLGVYCGGEQTLTEIHKSDKYKEILELKKIYNK